MSNFCRLCKEEKSLRYSHILPEFMYQNLYNKDIKRFYSFSVKVDLPNESKKRIEQKGVREYLLCHDCEVLLSKYEGYTAETLYGKNLKNKAYIAKSSETKDLKYFTYEYEGFNYKKFKLFLLSVLWRIIISKSFKTPIINELIIEKLRQAIINEDPLKYDGFGCLIQVIKYKKGQIAKGFILSPYMSGQKNDILNVLIDGFMYSFFLNSNIFESEKSFLLKPNGKMIVLGRIIFDDAKLFEKMKIAFDYFGDKE